MYDIKKLFKKILRIGIDLFLIAMAFVISSLLHCDFNLSGIANYSAYLAMLGVVAICYILTSYLCRVDKIIIRSFSLQGSLMIAKANVLAFVISVVFAWGFCELNLSRTIYDLSTTGSNLFTVYAPWNRTGMSGSLLIKAVSILAIHFFIYTLLSLAARFLYRIFRQRVLTKDAKNVLIIGAGQAATILIKDMLGNFAGQYYPVALLDDDHNLCKRYLLGVPVLGACHTIVDALESCKIDLIIIAIPSLRGGNLVQLVSNVALQRSIPVRILPGLSDLVDGRVSLNKLRNITIHELLYRKPINCAQLGTQFAEHIQGATVLVTGGGGSIGSELCRQIASYEPDKLIVLDHSEFNIYRIEQDLEAKYPRILSTTCLGSVTDGPFVDKVMARYRPQVVFHAAAYKHVPLLESQPFVALKNNVLGTKILVEAAHKYGVRSFTLISTDKAVNPANVMGSTKLASELICQMMNHRSDTKFSVVRFGNVLDSAGSVIPLFKQQIASGGPVTVTHPDITRYFMTIAEASQLVLQTICMGKGGEVYVLDMGEPIKIIDLADKLIRLSGKLPGEDIKIVYTGLRSGEKLHEELFYEKESFTNTDCKHIFLANTEGLMWEQVNSRLTQIITAIKYDEPATAITGLKSLVYDIGHPATSCAGVAI